MVAALAQEYIPNIWGVWLRLGIAIRRLFNPLPAVGLSTTFLVQERHWDEARIKCSMGSRSTHCVLAQAIAERFGLPYVSVGNSGGVQAAEATKPVTLTDLGGEYQSTEFVGESYFQVDEVGCGLISDFDYLPFADADPESKKPTSWPIVVRITRTEGLDD